MYILLILFLFQLPRMTRYVRFCSCQLNAAITLQKLTETNPAFCEVTKRCQSDQRIKGLPLSSFLIKPMQRITKYPLLVQKVCVKYFLHSITVLFFLNIYIILIL